MGTRSKKRQMPKIIRRKGLTKEEQLQIVKARMKEKNHLRRLNDFGNS